MFHTLLFGVSHFSISTSIVAAPSSPLLPTISVPFLQFFLPKHANSLASFAFPYDSPSQATSSHHISHQSTHQYLKPDSFIGSWETPKNPEEAKAKLVLLRREYGKKVKDARKEYIKEMEMMRLEKQRKDAAKKEALRLQTEERRKLKAEAAKVRAEERKIAQEEFRQMLLKERAEKLEHWRMKERIREEKKKEKCEGLRRQSSLWIDENELERKILEAVCQIGPTEFCNHRI